MEKTRGDEKTEFFQKAFGKKNGNFSVVPTQESVPYESEEVLKSYLLETRWICAALKKQPKMVQAILRVLSVTKDNSLILGFEPVYKLEKALETFYKFQADAMPAWTENVLVLLKAAAAKIDECCGFIERGDFEGLLSLDVRPCLLYLDKAVAGEIFDAKRLLPKKALSAPKEEFDQAAAAKKIVGDPLIQIKSSKLGQLVSQQEEMIARSYIIVSQVEALRAAILDGNLRAAKESCLRLGADSQSLQSALLVSHEQAMSFASDASFFERHKDFHGFFVLSNGRKYLVPSEFVVDVISESPLNYKERQNQKFVVYIQENEAGDEKAREEIPVYSLSSLLPGSPLKERNVLDTIILVNFQSQKIGIMVDAMLKFVSLIKKPLPNAFKNFKVLSGLAFDEKYDMIPILSVPQIMKKFRALRGYDVKKFEVKAKKRTPRALVVDDSDTARLIERSILESHGFSVEEAFDGIDALEKIKARSFDLVLCDDKMPRMNGEIFLDNLRRVEGAKKIPVIAISEKAVPKADAYMSKSDFDRDVLAQKIKELLHG